MGRAKHYLSALRFLVARNDFPIRNVAGNNAKQWMRLGQFNGRKLTTQ